MPRQSLRCSALVVFWRVINPLATPLAAGPVDDDEMLLIAVHGDLSAWVRNLEAEPSIRVRHRGRWRAAQASVEPLHADVLRRFNIYARSGPRLVGIDPVLVRCRFI